MSVVEIEVLNPGIQSTIQDLGRFGFAHLGISSAGAADALSLRIGNRLVGNDDNAAAIEMTLVGASLRFLHACTIALTGAEITAGVVPMFEPVQVDAGFVLECGPLRGGARTYLAVNGGIAVPKILGSASTHLGAGFGGLQGRALKRGDVLEVENKGGATRPASSALLRKISQQRRTIHVTKGPQLRLFAEDTLERLCSSEYVVTEQSNRLGLRLAGPAVEPAARGELLTEGVSLGAIQIPPNGQPIVLFVDQQTTGGYPKLANVIAADMHCIGQLRPRDIVRFERVSIDEAIQFLRQQEYRLAEAFRE
ncbi:MAG: biotin-dependent carboxyltransferase family protein [Terriglobia bacterium]|nr:biotin-dependent carboxyltransferase family protein [Terriglobia bacterium]